MIGEDAPFIALLPASCGTLRPATRSSQQVPALC